MKLAVGSLPLFEDRLPFHNPVREELPTIRPLFSIRR